jgi:hypothetical protein
MPGPGTATKKGYFGRKRMEAMGKKKEGKKRGK